LPYWHGAFGGSICAFAQCHLQPAHRQRELADQAIGKTGGFVEATVDDYNFDLRQEVRWPATSSFACCPSRGQMYELDVRTICHNLLATLSRRPKHITKRSSAARTMETPTSPASRPGVFKQAGWNSVCSMTRRRARACSITFMTRTRREQVLYGEPRSEATSSMHLRHEDPRGADRVQVQLTRRESLMDARSRSPRV